MSIPEWPPGSDLADTHITRPRPRLPDPGQSERGEEEPQPRRELAELPPEWPGGRIRQPSELPRRAREKLFDRDDWKTMLTIVAILLVPALVAGFIGGLLAVAL